MISERRHGWRTGLAAALVSIPLACLPSIAMAADADLPSGSDWEVTQAPGGYLVTVDLDKKLPIVSDAPTIEVDGVPIGLATESADGKSLSVFTADPAVVAADGAEAGWFSSPSNGPKAATSSARTAPATATADAETLDADPASLGTYEFTEAVYDFGTQSVPLAGIGGIRGELQGKIYLPKTGGARPTVMLLHGRHTSCASGTANPDRWPCGANQINIPSFAGYDGTARALASHGYAVVSIAANAINSNDNQLAADRGAQARGQLMLDTLSMLDTAGKGQSVSYYDAQKKKDVTLADALANQAALPGLPATEATAGLSPADLVGRFDLTKVGMMGHSRGGEGVTSAATLNQGLAKPWGITSILPLAPVDFGRMTVPNVAMNVILPYCDGDVSGQQGQHMLDDSRYAFDDDSLRSGVWAMGANHNFFNTVWTPGAYSYSTSDDWGATSSDAVCGPRAATNIRMTAQEQYDMGTAYMAGWFRLTLGGEDQFLPMFDGTGAVPAVLNGEDVRSMATAPSSERAAITSFEQGSTPVRAQGAATATVCASISARTVGQVLPACSTALGTSAVPHWSPMLFGGNVPATPVTKLAWTALSTDATSPSEVSISVPKSARNAGGFDRLSFKAAADETVVTGTDLKLTVVDGKGAAYSAPVSALNPLALKRMPESTSLFLKKIVLQQVNVPTSALAGAGLDLSDIREVRFAAATGADGKTTGAAVLSDLAFENSSVGTPVVKTERTIDLSVPTVNEGSGPGTADLAVYLDAPAAKPVTGYVSVLGTATGRGGLTMEKVTFAPGETCKIVTAPILGDTATSTSTSTAVGASVVNTSGAVMGKKAFGSLVVREDDGMTNTTPLLPSAGIQGDACAELAASRTTGKIVLDQAIAAPGQDVTITASGYRVGESVAVTLGDKALASGIADGSGQVVVTAPVPAAVTLGENAVTAVGSGTGFTSKGSIEVLNATATSLSMSPEIPEINQAVTLTAQVAGPDTAGTVEFFDGTTPLGTSTVTEGMATLAVNGFKAGEHSITAVFGKTATAQSSTSAPVGLTLTKGKSGIALQLAAGSASYGSAVTGSVQVQNGDGGTVTVTFGGTSIDVPVTGAGTAGFTIPAGLAAGSYDVSATYKGTDKVDPSGVASAVLTIAKKATAASVSTKSSVKKGKTLTVKTAIRGAVAGTFPTGTVKVYVKTSSGKYALKKTVTLKAGGKGVVSTGVKVTRKKATIRVKTVFSGNGNYAGSTTGTKVVKVK